MKTFQSTLLLLIMLLLAGGTFAQKAGKSGMETVKINTSAECDMCKNTIEKKLIYQKGVKSVTVDIKTGVTTVEYKPSKATVEDIRKGISELGYTADEVKADAKAYDALPDCCKSGERH